MERIRDYWVGLLAFVRVAEGGSFTAAARLLGLSPSAVGRAITRLERRLGVTLVKRSTRSLALTPEGRAFLERIGPAVAAIREAEGATGTAQLPAGSVRLSAATDLGRLLVASWTGEFANNHPQLSLELSITDRLVDLRSDGVDIAIRLGSLPPAGVASQRLGSIGYAIVASPAYLAEHGRPTTVAALAAHNCLQYLTIDGVPLRWTLAGREIATQGGFATDDGGALLGAALGGAGIAYMLRFAVDQALADGRLVELLADVRKTTLPISLSHAFGANPPARVRATLDFLRARLLPLTVGH